MELMPSNSSFSPNSILITVSIDLPASAAYPVLYLHPRTYAASSTSYADYKKWCMHERSVRILQPLAAICWIVWRFLHLFHFLNRIKLFRMFVHFDCLALIFIILLRFIFEIHKNVRIMLTASCHLYWKYQFRCILWWPSHDRFGHSLNFIYVHLARAWQTVRHGGEIKQKSSGNEWEKTVFVSCTPTWALISWSCDFQWMRMCAQNLVCSMDFHWIRLLFLTYSRKIGSISFYSWKCISATLDGDKNSGSISSDGLCEVSIAIENRFVECIDQSIFMRCMRARNLCVFLFFFWASHYISGFHELFIEFISGFSITVLFRLVQWCCLIGFCFILCM